MKKTLSYSIVRNSYYKLGDLLNLIQLDITQANLYWKSYFGLLAFPIFFGIGLITAIIQLGTSITLTGVGVAVI
jgi:hypothetical protein